MNPLPRPLWGLYALFAIIVVGTGGYIVIEGWSFLDSLYMTVITITTVGYEEVHPLGIGGRIFSLFLIVSGVGAALYALTGFIAFVMEGYFGITFGRRMMKNRIAKLKDHFIICGLGRVGEEIASTFKEEGVPFVVIDNRAELLTRAEQKGFLFIEGDATKDEVLKDAGIERARSLVVALGDDADNLYITLSARALSPALFIEARSSTEEVAKKLKRAGADRVISPYNIGARRMAILALRPAVVEFIDTLVYRRGKEIQLESVMVDEKSTMTGLRVEEARQRTKAVVLAINKKSGKLVANPSDEEVVEAGDRIIVMGSKEQLQTLESICERCKSDE